MDNILLQGADALERAHRIRTIVFDKTGTLTRGKPIVTDVRLFDTQVLHHLQLCHKSSVGRKAAPKREHADEQVERQRCVDLGNDNVVGLCPAAGVPQGSHAPGGCAGGAERAPTGISSDQFCC